MSDLSIGDFEPRLGEALPVRFADGEVRLKLAAAEALPGSPRPAGGFRLEFAGPIDPSLHQGVYRFELGDVGADIFIVPLGPDGEDMRYEAVFF